MRGPALLVVVVVFVAGCVTRSQSIDDPDPDPGQGFPGDDVNRCRSDSQCSSGQVCTRTHDCLPPDQVRTVHAEWTVRGMEASLQTCAAVRDLQITFLVGAGNSQPQSFAPVPCVQGKFTVDKLPVTYDRVELGGTSGQAQQNASIDASGTAKLDLPY